MVHVHCAYLGKPLLNIPMNNADSSMGLMQTLRVGGGLLASPAGSYFGMGCSVLLSKALADLAKMGLLAGSARSCQPHLLNLDGTYGCALRGALLYGIQPAIAALLLWLCCVQATQIPIGDAVAGPPWPPFDLIILDEAQDVNPVTLDVRARA